MKKILIITIACTFLALGKGYGQAGSYMSVQYGMSFGSGDLSDYISKASFRGAIVEYRQAMNDNLRVGFDLGWNTFYEKKDYDTYTVGTETISGVQLRTQNQVPILVSADYHLTSETLITPFIGFGLGTMYTERSTEMNLYSMEENVWSFVIKPEVGLLYEMSYSTSFKIAAKYYNGFKTNNLDTQSYFSISAGLAFRL